MPSEEELAKTVESKTAIEALDPTHEPEPSDLTGLGTHFRSTFDPALKKNAPNLPDTAIAPAPASAKQKLQNTNSTMTTAQLQKAAQEGDPNGLNKQ
ncbi:hypothetical protein CKM354_000012700 [Cercospora kikuchii]|uniref:Uncharacterized protein n=1 Tax=Cercospora kikuchii TaxID=84275 RepID=A0A9P3CDA6_9PEZI|nr:uncharacterized protein CKM354_000012700 [Cercospora kikuchii]GIZ36658.1 hypothetical protein CKM354_000012700 [Cercospora kikuchii]